MTKSKKQYYKKELTCCGKTKHENKKLKKDNKQLKKMLNDSVTKMSYYNQVLEITKTKKKEEKMVDKEDWLCNTCGRGYLNIVRLYQKNGVWYIRMCDNDNCDYKTAKQKWHSGVVGLE